MCLFKAQVTFGPEVRRYLLPVFMSSTEGPVTGRPARVLLRTLADEAREGSKEDAPAGLANWLDEAEGLALDGATDLADRLEESERNRIRPRVAEARTRFDRRIDSGHERARLAEREGDHDRAKSIRTYVRRVEREKERKLETLERLPDCVPAVEPVAAAWVTATAG
jgi:hypothetical protein